MQRAGRELAESGQADRALTGGAQAPRFSLPSATGHTVALDDLLADAVVLTFYRGAWCPYCNIALRSLQQHHDASAPAAPAWWLSPPRSPTSPSPRSAFHVLSDIGSDTAEQYGLAFDLPDDLAAVYDNSASTSNASTAVPPHAAAARYLRHRPRRRHPLGLRRHRLHHPCRTGRHHRRPRRPELSRPLDVGPDGGATPSRSARRTPPTAGPCLRRPLRQPLTGRHHQHGPAQPDRSGFRLPRS
jgi:hypothetical protein